MPRRIIESGVELTLIAAPLDVLEDCRACVNFRGEASVVGAPSVRR